MLQLIGKLFGTQTVADMVSADTNTTIQDPCSRYIEFSSAETYASFGRDRRPDDFVRNTATTPETAAMQYRKI